MKKTALIIFMLLALIAASVFWPDNESQKTSIFKTSPTTLQEEDITNFPYKQKNETKIPTHHEEINRNEDSNKSERN